MFQLTLGIRRRFWNLLGKERTPGPFSPYLLYFSPPVPAARRIFLNSLCEYLHPLISNLHSFPTSVQEIQTKPHSLVYFSAWSQCSHLPPPCPQPHPFFSSESSAGLLHTLGLSRGTPLLWQAQLPGFYCKVQTKCHLGDTGLHYSPHPTPHLERVGPFSSPFIASRT